MAKVLRLPDHGRLIVCTDLQGCMRDFQRVAQEFRKRLIQTGDAYLLFTGDLIHGPHLTRTEWPVFLGEYYCDQSGDVMDSFVDLQEEFPDRIFAILGNHEHGHIGGPHTAKFARDEVALLEHHLGHIASQRLRMILRELPLIAVSPCGVVFTHGAPAAEISSLSDIERAKLDLKVAKPTDIFKVPVIGPLLWARSASPEIARRFLKACGGRLCIYGHDVIPSGFQKIGDEQMVLSTSFGVADKNKYFVELDLGSQYHSVRDLEIDRELLRLYPET